MRLCKTCGEMKELEEFPKIKPNKGGRHNTLCKVCYNLRAKKYRDDLDQGKLSERRKKAYHSVPDDVKAGRAATKKLYSQKPDVIAKKKAHAKTDKGKYQTKIWNLMTTYKLSEEKYREMMESQGGRCDSCGDWLEEPVVDHDHSSGEVRALLCGDCNKAVGHLQEEVYKAEGVLSYIRRRCV